MKFLTILLVILSFKQNKIIFVFFTFYLLNTIFLIIYKRILFNYKKEFFWVRFLFPLFMFNIFSKYWLDKNIFFIIWVISWILALLNLIWWKKSTKIKNEDLMINNYLIYVFWRFIFGILFLIFSKLNNIYIEYFVIISSFIIVIIMEYSSKLRSIGFVQFLKDQANFYSNKENNNLVYNSFLTTFVIFKALGWALGFWVAFVLYYFVKLQYIVIIMSVFSLMYWIFIKYYFRKNYFKIWEN